MPNMRKMLRSSLILLGLTLAALVVVVWLDTNEVIVGLSPRAISTVASLLILVMAIATGGMIHAGLDLLAHRRAVRKGYADWREHS